MSGDHVPLEPSQKTEIMSKNRREKEMSCSVGGCQFLS